jgi:hypothetical protein
MRHPTLLHALSSTRTTRLYDRRREELSFDEAEQIRV